MNVSLFEKLKIFKKNYNDNGFSLLELVVAVGILLVLTVGGLLAYNGITKNARQAALDNAVAEIYTAGMANWADNSPDTDMKDVIENWAKSSGYYYSITSDNSDGEHQNDGTFLISSKPLANTDDINENVIYYGTYIMDIEAYKNSSSMEDNPVDFKTNGGVYVQMLRIEWNKDSDGNNVVGADSLTASKG